jgi:Dolichyl-phosphate-mannose-protein mannosyltransferase
MSIHWKPSKCFTMMLQRLVTRCRARNAGSVGKIACPRIWSVSLFALRMCERHERIAGGAHHRWRQRAESQSLRRRLNIHVLPAYALVVVALAYFAVMASRQIALPGLYYDEARYVNPAIGGVEASMRIFGIPVMVVPYVGALKAYLYFPIFALFGVSAETIRLPTIFISLLTLGVAFALARLTFRPTYSALFVLLMAVDPMFIFMSKADYGPIVLMMFFKVLALYFFFRFIVTSSPHHLWGLAVACGLGLYDKLNFIWFVLALVVAAVVVFRHELRVAAAHHRAHFILPVGALLFGLVGSALYSMPLFIHTQPYDVGALERIEFVLRLYIHTMDSRDVWFIPARFSIGTLTNWITIAVIGTIIIAGISRLARTKQSSTLALTDRVVIFYLLIFVLIFMQIIVTNAADSPNHVMMLYPFHYVLLIGVANRLSDTNLVHPRSGRWTSAVPVPRSGGRLTLGDLSAHRSHVGLVIAAVIGLLVGSQINVGVRYQEVINKRQFDHLWTPAIYELAAYVEQREVDAVISANWGIHNPVFALVRAEVRGRYADLWQQFTGLDEPEEGSVLAERFFLGKRVLVLAYATDKDKGAAIARQHFLSFAQYYFGGAVLERAITNDRGETIFAVYYIDARSSKDA